MKKEETKSTTVAVLGATDVPGMLKTVTDQIKMIKGNLPVTPKTDGSLPDFGKVEDIKTLDNIIKAASMVSNKEKAYNEAAILVVPIGVKTPKFKIGGMNASDVIDHLKVKAVEVGNKEQLDKLNKIKKTLESNLSAEAKLANDLASIKKMLTEDEK